MTKRNNAGSEQLGLREGDVAFYDAIVINDSALWAKAHRLLPKYVCPPDLEEKVAELALEPAEFSAMAEGE